MDQNSNLDDESRKGLDRSANQSPERKLLFDVSNTETMISSITTDGPSQHSFSTSSDEGLIYQPSAPLHKKTQDVAGRLWSPRFPGEGRLIRDKLNTREPLSSDSEEDHFLSSSSKAPFSPHFMDRVKGALLYNPNIDSDETDSDVEINYPGLCRYRPDSDLNATGLVNPINTSSDMKLPSISQTNSRSSLKIKYSHLL